MIPLVYCPFGNIVVLKTPFKPIGVKTLNHPLPLGDVDRIRRPTPLTTTNDISIDSRNFTQLHHKVLFGYNGMPHIHPKTTLPLRRSPLYVIHSSLDRPHSSLEMTCKSYQPFFHNLLTGRTDRQIGWATSLSQQPLTLY